MAVYTKTEKSSAERDSTPAKIALPNDPVHPMIKEKSSRVNRWNAMNPFRTKAEEKIFGNVMEWLEK